jgi:hypothetical protein
MLKDSIKAHFRRLQLHPVNLDVDSEVDGNVVLKGSLLRSWQVPTSVNGHWLLKVLTGLPNLAGPEKTMDAYYEAYTAEGVGKV